MHASDLRRRALVYLETVEPVSVRRGPGQTSFPPTVGAPAASIRQGGRYAAQQLRAQNPLWTDGTTTTTLARCSWERPAQTTMGELRLCPRARNCADRLGHLGVDADLPHT